MDFNIHINAVSYFQHKIIQHSVKHTQTCANRKVPAFHITYTHFETRFRINVPFGAFKYETLHLESPQTNRPSTYKCQHLKNKVMPGKQIENSIDYTYLVLAYTTTLVISTINAHNHLFVQMKIAIWHRIFCMFYH